MRPFDLDEYLKNPERKVVTRDGRNARIICTDAGCIYKEDKYSIIALIKEVNKNNEVVYSFLKNGSFVKNKVSKEDLFFAPEKHEGWINIYKRNNGTYRINSIVYNSKTEANAYKGNDHIATLKIEWEE